MILRCRVLQQKALNPLPHITTPMVTTSPALNKVIFLGIELTGVVERKRG